MIVAIMYLHPGSEQALCVLIALHLNGPPQADKLGGAESIKHLLGRGSIVGIVLEAVVDQVLHVWPWRKAIVLNVVNGPPLVIIMNN